MKRIARVLLACAGIALAAPGALPRFSAAVPGAMLPEGWRLVPFVRVKPVEASLVTDEGATVVRIRSEAAAGTIAARVDADVAATPVFRWRWKVDRALKAADMTRRDADDYAARVYVAFDLPSSSMTAGERARLALGRFLYGAEVPAAALCYVWDNRHPPGTSAWNTHSAQVRMVVVEGGSARAGQWVEVSRDVEADYRAAFGGRYPGPVPRIAGVAISADTDQTGETVTAWFGDLVLEPRR